MYLFRGHYNTFILAVFHKNERNLQANDN